MKPTDERLQELYLEKAMERYEEATGQTAMEELASELEPTTDAAGYVARLDTRRKRRLFCRKVGRRALVLLAALITCFVFLMGTVSAFRVSVLNFFYSGKFADLGESENTSKFTDWDNEILPQYIPPDFALSNLHIESDVLCATYLKKGQARIDYTAYPSETEHFLDTETNSEQDAVAVEINGAKGLLIHRADAVSVSWWSGSRFFELYSCNATEEELLRMAESVQIN